MANPILPALILALVASACGDGGSSPGDPTTPWTTDAAGPIEEILPDGEADLPGPSPDALRPLADAPSVPDLHTGLPDSAGDDGPADDHDGGGCPGTVCASPAKVCVVACATAADCPYVGVTAGGVYDGDNWTCTDGKCGWKGCLSNAECAAEPGFDYAPMVCANVGGGFKSCVPSCSVPSDCPHPAVSDARFDADNYACQGGACIYTGCSGDGECQQSLAATGLSWVCRDLGNGYKGCASQCTTPADCVYLDGNVLFDADNYECVDGLCRHLGCQADAECAAAYRYAEADYVCADSFLSR